jgi:nitrate reductase delta subunit
VNGELLARLADVLEYPAGDLGEQCTALSRLLEEERPGAAHAIEDFGRAINGLPLSRMEEIYAATFDVNPVCCLYVGYHLFGESYKRGAFMARLDAEYRQCGFEPGNELPDHLPVLLRYLATLEDPEQRSSLLEDAVLPALAKIAKGFDGTGNVYAALVQLVLLALEPSGFVHPSDDSRALPVLESIDQTSGEWNDGKHF